jgi:hypothetical protein
VTSALPALVPVGQFALGVALRAERGDLSALLVSDGIACEAVARSLAGEIDPTHGLSVALVALSERVIPDLRAARQDVLVVYEQAAVTAALWHSLDSDRSLLPRGRSIVFVLPVSSYARLEREAPNLASWFGAAVSLVDPDADALTAEERERLLQRLREKFALSDEDLVARAVQGTAPDEPDVALWLVLLGRGDLLERR